MPAEAVIGWDIGGAHIKACLVSADGQILKTTQTICPLWQGVDQLHAAVQRVLSQFAVKQAFHAITMTGELADIFSDRSEGVQSILATMAIYCLPERTLIYAGRAGFLDEAAALARSLEVASANWLASAAWVADRIPAGLLIDIGSTTTDIIPFADKSIRVQSVTDQQRMINGELVYTGVTRTPLMAVADQVPLAALTVPLMAECFATTADIYRILGQLPAHADLHPAADNGAKTVGQSMRRMARMVAADKEEYPDEEWRVLAEYFSQQQREKIIEACMQVISRGILSADAPIVAAGIGRFLLPGISRQLQRTCIDFTDCLDSNISQDEFDIADCAPAVAVALLAWKQNRPS